MRALVQWWGGYGQTVRRPYLWKKKPADTGYKEDWSDSKKAPERFAVGQVAGMGQNSRYQKSEGKGGSAPADTEKNTPRPPKKTVARLLFAYYLTIFTSVI